MAAVPLLTNGKLTVTVSPGSIAPLLAVQLSSDTGAGELAVFCGAMVGASLGYDQLAVALSVGAMMISRLQFVMILRVPGREFTPPQTGPPTLELQFRC